MELLMVNNGDFNKQNTNSRPRHASDKINEDNIRNKNTFSDNKKAFWGVKYDE